MIVHDDIPRMVAYAIARSPPRTLQGEDVRQRVLAYFDAVTDESRMSPQTQHLLRETAEMFHGSLEPVATRLDAFVMAFTLLAQANQQPI